VTVEDEVAWLDALAGRVGPRDPTRSSSANERLNLVQEALALRAFIRAQEIQNGPAVPTVDAARERELIERARAAGLLSAAAPARVAPLRRRWFASSRTGFAAVATVILVIGAAGIWRSTLPPPETLRGIVGGTVHLEARDPPALKRQLVEELAAAGVSVSGYERFGHLGFDADLPMPVSAAVAQVLERHHIPIPRDGALVVEIDPAARR
jgi:chorismate mutase